MFISSAFFTRVDWKRFMNYATSSRTPALEPAPTAPAALRRTLVCSRNETQRTTKLICKFNEYARSWRSWSRRRGSCRKKLSSELNHPLPPPPTLHSPPQFPTHMTGIWQSKSSHLELCRLTSFHLDASVNVIDNGGCPPCPLLLPLPSSARVLWFKWIIS